MKVAYRDILAPCIVLHLSALLPIRARRPLLVAFFLLPNERYNPGP